MALAAQADAGVEILPELDLVSVPTADRRGFAILRGPGSRSRRHASPGGNEL